MGFSGKFGWVVLSLAGIVLVILSTRWGIGISPDSVVYIGGARNLIQGRGFSMPTAETPAEPITHHAPLYSALLALPGRIGIDPLIGSRLINAALFGANIALAWFLIARFLPGASKAAVVWLSALGAWFILTSPTLLEIHLMAWSEALFLFLGFLGFYLLARYLEFSKTRDLVGSIVLVAMAMLTRYAGVVMAATGILVIMLFLHKSWGDRIKEALLFGVMSILPLGVWLIRNLLIAGTATNRELFFHPIDKSQISFAITTCTSWLLIPDATPNWIKLPLLLGVASTVLIAFRLTVINKAEIPWIIKILVIFIPIYFVFLAFSVSFLDANTLLDERILSPVYIASLILLVYSIRQIMEKLSSLPIARTVMICVVIVLAGGYIYQGGKLVTEAYNLGLGFDSVAWERSKTLGLIEALPAGIPIYTNAPEAVYIHTGRPASRIPPKYDKANQQSNNAYTLEVNNMRTALVNRGGVVVIFNIIQRMTLDQENEIKKELNLGLYSQTTDGAVYVSRQPQ